MFLEENPERIEMFRNLGVRIMQITYNKRSSFGDGCLEPGNAGLSKAGVAAIKRMNESGVAVDLSHSGYRTTSEAIAASSKPVLISHSGCAALYAHPRNKPVGGELGKHLSRPSLALVLCELGRARIHWHNCFLRPPDHWARGRRPIPRPSREPN